MPWIARRTLRAVLLGWAVATIVILATHTKLGEPSAGAPPPLYFGELAEVLSGNLGISRQSGAPVSEAIGRRLPVTLQLIGASVLLALLAGVPGGLLAGSGRYRRIDHIGGVSSAALLGIPAFVLGLLLMLLFGGTAQAWMPPVTLAIGFSAIVFRMTRGAVRDVMRQGFVRVARAKGLSSWRILLRHVPRNAMPAMLTGVAAQLGLLLGSAALIEYLFDLPGVFSLLIDAIWRRDYPAVQGIVLAGSLMCIALRLAADVICVALDPRLRAA